MMTDIFPAGVQAAGNNTFVWSKVAPAIAGSPTVAEINAATALDITCYVKTDAFQVGFDQPRDMGGYVQGGTVAAPIFKQWAKQAYEGLPVLPFRAPNGIGVTKP